MLNSIQPFQICSSLRLRAELGTTRLVLNWAGSKEARLSTKSSAEAYFKCPSKNKIIHRTKKIKWLHNFFLSLERKL